MDELVCLSARLVAEMGLGSCGPREFAGAILLDLSVVACGEGSGGCHGCSGGATRFRLKQQERGPEFAGAIPGPFVPKENHSLLAEDNSEVDDGTCLGFVKTM